MDAGPMDAGSMVRDDFRWFLATWFPAAFATALFDQTALPSVAAGIESTGRILDEPYPRAIRSAAADQLVFLAAEPERREEVARLIRLHRDVKGTSTTGVRYSALHPESWNWILVSTFIMYRGAFVTVTGHRPSPEVDQTLWEYFWDLTGPLQLDDDRFKLPERHDDAMAWYDGVVERRCERTAVFDQVDRFARSPRLPPGIPRPVATVWTMTAAPVMGRAISTLGYGLMRPNLRARVGIPWGTRERVEFTVLTTLLRVAHKTLPRRVSFSPLGYNRWRYEELTASYKALGLTSFAPDPTSS